MMLNGDAKCNNVDNSSQLMHADSAEVASDTQSSTAANAEQDPTEQAKLKRKYVIMELVETEKDYVRDLGLIVDGYIRTIEQMQLPDDMKGKERIVFANLEKIFEFHKTTFQSELEKSLEDFQAAAKAFVKYERRLHMYVVYCQNKPKSEFLVSEYETFFSELRQKLGQKLSVGDMLIKPVQRIMKYQLLLKDILKYTQRAEEDTEYLEKAMQVMRVVPKACDDMMHVGRLQGYDGKITAQGKLMLQGTLLVSENPPSQVFKGKERRVFLFEQSLIMADCILPKKEFSNPTYIFKNHILINKMGVDANIPGEPLRFVLKNKDPNSSGQDFLLQAPSDEVKEEWLLEIRKLLQTQMDFLRALQSPIAYQKEKEGGQQRDGSTAAMSHKDSISRKKSPIINRITGHLRAKTSHSGGSIHASHSTSTPTISESAECESAHAGTTDSADRNAKSSNSKAAAASQPPLTPTSPVSSSSNTNSPRSAGGGSSSGGRKLFNGFKSFKLKKNRTSLA